MSRSAVVDVVVDRLVRGGEPEVRRVDSIETATVIYVHGGVVPELPVDKVEPVVLRWQRFPPDRPHVSGRLVVCGHTIQRDHRPRLIRGSLGIDTDADRGGWLTAVDVDAGRYWQANEAGQTREGVVDLTVDASD